MPGATVGAVAAGDADRSRGPIMDTRAMKIDDLKARVAREDYDVDPDAVADAFVNRMLAVHRALRRSDVRELLGDGLDEISLFPHSSCS
jgi:hypothetical protein